MISLVYAMLERNMKNKSNIPCTVGLCTISLVLAYNNIYLTSLSWWIIIVIYSVVVAYYYEYDDA